MSIHGQRRGFHVSLFFRSGIPRYQQLSVPLVLHPPTTHHAPLLQVLHLIRHGEGFHNVAGRKNHELYKVSPPPFSWCTTPLLVYRPLVCAR
jgi:hypothetical protein